MTAAETATPESCASQFNLQQAIYQGTAEMLAIPQRICFQRQCRREQRCLYIEDNEIAPPCIGNLTDVEKPHFETLRALVERLACAFYQGKSSEFLWNEPRELALAACEILYAIMAHDPAIRRSFPQFWARYKKLERKEQAMRRKNMNRSEKHSGMKSI